MREEIIQSVLATSLLLSSGSACALNAPEPPRCVVIGGDKLPAASGGAAGLCAAIDQAVSRTIAKADYQVEVRVLSKSRLSAAVAIAGRKLPEQNMATMDRDLSKSSFEHFAATIAAEMAKIGG